MMQPVTQLDPPYSLITPIGRGWAHLLIFLGIEHHLVWVVVDDATGQVWQWENPHVRFDPNYTWGRPSPEKPLPCPMPGVLNATNPPAAAPIRADCCDEQSGRRGVDVVGAVRPSAALHRLQGAGQPGDPADGAPGGSSRCGSATPAAGSKPRPEREVHER